MDSIKSPFFLAAGVVLLACGAMSLSRGGLAFAAT